MSDSGGGEPQFPCEHAEKLKRHGRKMARKSGRCGPKGEALGCRGGPGHPSRDLTACTAHRPVLHGSHSPSAPLSMPNPVLPEQWGGGLMRSEPWAGPKNTAPIMLGSRGTGNGFRGRGSKLSVEDSESVRLCRPRMGSVAITELHRCGMKQP